MYKNPRYANQEHIGVLVDYIDGSGVLYVDDGLDYTEIKAGKYGAVLTYSEPQAPIAELATGKLARIRAARHAIEFGGMMHGGIMYDSDATARAKYSETDRVFRLMPDLEIEGWKASDGPDGQGVYVTMTKPLLGALTLAGAQHDGACFAWERARAAEVAAAVAAEDREALLAISEVM